MIPFTIKLDGDGAWPDLKDGRTLHHVKGGMGLAVLDGGMKSGLPSVAIRIDLPDGSTVIAETSAKLFVSAAQVLHAKYPRILDQ